MRSGVLCFYRIGICIFLKRDSGLRRTSEEIFFLYTSNPSPKKLPYLRCLPYITNVTPRNTTGHGRGEGCSALSRCIKNRQIVEIRNVSPSSSPVFCYVKYRGGVTQGEGIEKILAEKETEADINLLRLCPVVLRGVTLVI